MNIQKWAIERVLPYALNAKVHDDEQVARIAKSIKELGWDQPIVVDADGVIIKGHGRRLAAISLGFKEVPVLVRDDLTPEQVRAARLADNRVAISNIDADLLAQELATLEFDLDGIFDKKELDFVTADLGELNTDAFVADLDAEIEAQAQETAATIKAAADKSVSIAKALGFKTIKGNEERLVATFMAECEATTGLSGSAAFIAYITGQHKVAA